MSLAWMIILAIVALIGGSVAIGLWLDLLVPTDDICFGRD